MLFGEGWCRRNMGAYGLAGVLKMLRFPMV